MRKEIHIFSFPLIHFDRHYPCVLQAMSSVHTKEGNASKDFSLVVKEYTGFITFVYETPPPGNHQLSHFLFPFYVYVYLFLLKNQKFKEAQKFISIYSSLFLNTEGYAEIVQDLVKFKSLEEFQDHSYLKNFCESKYGYKVQLSEDNLKLLKKYLEDSESGILNHILHRKFNIEVIKDQSNSEHTTESSSIKKKESTTQKTESPENSSSTRSKYIKKSSNEHLSNNEHITESLSIKKKESTKRSKSTENSLSTRSIYTKKSNSAIEDQSNREHVTESLSIRKKKPIPQRTKSSENSSSTKSIDIKKSNNLIKDQSNCEHTTESLSIRKRKPIPQRTKSSENSSSTKIIGINKTNIVIENQSSHECTTEISSNKDKESTSQRIEISEKNLLTRRIDVKELKNRLLSEVPCYHYTIRCRREQLCCVDINQNNTLLACGFESSGIHIWKLDPNIANKSVFKKLNVNESKRLATNLSNNTASSPSLRCVLNGHSGGVYGLAYASGLLMSCSEDTTARAWSMTDFKDVRAYCDHKYPIWDITVSSNHAYFATASLDCTARLWSFTRTSPLRIFVGHSSDVDHVRFHSNCRYLATASADKTIQLWSVEDGRSMRKFPGHDTHINSITFSPDGKQLASADDSGHIKIWDLASGKLHSEIVAHSKKILSISYNEDSSLIASCSVDNFIKIWDVKHSLSMDEKGKSEVQAMSLVDSHSVDSVPHYVGFRQNDFLISVGAETMTEH